jgi:hypothetical protein
MMIGRDEPNSWIQMARAGYRPRHDDQT